MGQNRKIFNLIGVYLIQLVPNHQSLSESFKLSDEGSEELSEFESKLSSRMFESEI